MEPRVVEPDRKYSLLLRHGLVALPAHAHFEFEAVERNGRSVGATVGANGDAALSANKVTSSSCCGDRFGGKIAPVLGIIAMRTVSGQF